MESSLAALETIGERSIEQIGEMISSPFPPSSILEAISAPGYTSELLLLENTPLLAEKSGLKNKLANFILTKQRMAKLEAQIGELKENLAKQMLNVEQKANQERRNDEAYTIRLLKYVLSINMLKSADVGVALLSLKSSLDTPSEFDDWIIYMEEELKDNVENLIACAGQLQKRSQRLQKAKEGYKANGSLPTQPVKVESVEAVVVRVPPRKHDMIDEQDGKGVKKIRKASSSGSESTSKLDNSNED